MAGFNLTAQLNLAGPTNIKKIASDIRRELGTINSVINVKIDSKAATAVKNLNANISQLNAGLKQLSSNTAQTNSNIRNLSQSLNSIKNNKLAQDTDKLSKSTQNLGNQSQKAAKDVSRMKTELAEFGRQSGLAIRRFAAFSLVSTVMYKLNSAVNSSIDSFIAFDKEVVRLSQVTGKSKDELSGLVNTLRGLSTSLGVSSDQLIQVTSTLAQAGLTARQTEEALKALALSVNAPSFDNLQDTTEGVIAAMRQFSISASDLTQVLGSINAVSAQFAVEAGDIIKAIQRTGGVFASASRGVAEGTDALNQFIAVFTQVRATTRESAETIATGLRTIFARIQRKDTIEALREFGVELTDLEGKFVGPYEAIARLSAVLGALDPRSLEVAEITEQLGGFRQIGKVIPLIQQFSTAQAALNAAQAGAGSLLTDNQKAQQALAVQLTKVREEFKALISDIGNNTALQSFLKLTLGVTGAVLKLARAGKSLFPLLTLIGGFKAISGITQFAGGFLEGARPDTGQKRKGSLSRDIGQNIGGVLTGAKNESSTRELSSLAPIISNMASSINQQMVETKANTSALTLNTASIETLTTLLNSFGSTVQTNRTLNKGGKVLGFAKGGLVPGSGNTDTVSAKLTPGEFVMRKDAVQNIGTNQLHRMNQYGSGGAVQKLAYGGPAKNLVRTNIVDSDSQELMAFNDGDRFNIETKKQYITLKNVDRAKGTAIADEKPVKFPPAQPNQRNQVQGWKQWEDIIEALGYIRKSPENYPVDFVDSSGNMFEAKNVYSSVPDQDLARKSLHHILKQSIPDYDYNNPYKKIKIKNEYPLQYTRDQISTGDDNITSQRPITQLIPKYDVSSIDQQKRDEKLQGAIAGIFSKNPNSRRAAALQNDLGKSEVSTAGAQKLLSARNRLSINRFDEGGVVERRVGYIDYDVIANPANEEIVKRGMESVDVDGIRNYSDALVEAAIESRDYGNKKIRAIYGAAGSGKTTLARGQGTDDARLRKTIRFPILTPEDIDRATEILVLSSSVSQSKLDNLYENVDRAYTLSSTTGEEQNRILSQRETRDATGTGLEGRKAGSTRSAPSDTAVGEALLQERLGSRSVVLGRTESGRLRRKSGNELVEIIKKKIGFTWGGFSPMTLGHESIMDSAAAMGISPEDFIYMVGANEALKLGDPSSYRTAVFDQDARVLLAKAGAGSKGATVLPKAMDFEVPLGFDVGSKSGRRQVVLPESGSMALVAGKTEQQMEKYRSAGYDVANLERFNDISGTQVRDLIMSGDMAKLKEVLSPNVYGLISKNIDKIQNRAHILPELANIAKQEETASLTEIESKIAEVGITRIDKKKIEADPEYAARAEVLLELRKQRDKVKKRASFRPYSLLRDLEKSDPEKYALDFAMEQAEQTRSSAIQDKVLQQVKDRQTSGVAPVSLEDMNKALTPDAAPAAGAARSDILANKIVGAAILDGVSTTQSVITPEDVIKYTSASKAPEKQEETASRLRSVLEGRGAFTVVKQGLADAVSKKLAESSSAAQIEMYNRIFEDMGLPVVEGEENQANFLSSIPSIRGSILEAFMRNIQNQGLFPTAMSASSRSEGFDFRGGLGSELAKYFPDLASLSLVDAKASLAVATNEEMARKIGNEILSLTSGMKPEDIATSYPEIQEQTESGSKRSALKEAIFQKFSDVMSKLNRGTKILLPGTTGKDVLGYRGRLEEVYSQQGLSVTEGNDLVRQIWITGTSKNQPEESFSIKDLRMVTPIEELVTNKAFGGLVQRFMNGGEPKDAYVFDFDDTLATTEAKTFQDMNDPSLIQKAVATRYASLAKRRASLGDDIHVLTSRYGSDKILSAIRDFMGQNGIEAKSVIGVAGMFQDEREPGKRPGTTRKLSTASKKAKILTDLAARYGRVTFLDDDQENLLKASEIEGVRAVEAEREKLFKKRALGGLVQKFLEGGVAKKPTFGTGETKFPRRITNAYVREMEKQQNDLLLRKSIEQSKRRDQFIPGERVNIGEEEFGMISESMQKPFDLEAYKNTFEKRISRSEFFDRIGQFAQFIGLPQEDLGLVLPQFVDFGRIKGAGLFNRTGLSEKDLKKDAKHLDLSQHGYGEKEEQDLFGYTKLLEEKKKEVNKIIKTPTRTFEDGSFSYDYEAAEKVRKEIDDINNKIFSLEDKKAAAIAAAREAIKSKASATGRGSVGLSFGEFLADDVQQNVLYHEFTHQLINGLRTRSAESFDKYKERVSSLFSGDNDDLSDAFDSLGSYYNSADIVYGRSYKKGFLDSAIVRKGREKENAEFRGWSNIGGTPPPGTKEKDIPLSKEEYDNIQNIFTSLAKYSVEAEDAKTATQFRPLNPDINSLLLSTGYYDQSAIDRVEDIGKEEFLTTLMQKYPVLNQELQKALDGTLTELLGSAGVSRQKYAAGGLIQKFARGGSSYSRRPSKLVPQEKGMLSPSPFDVSQSKTDYYSLLDQYPELSKEFDSLAYFAKSADFNLQEFERYLQQRIQYKQQYANIRTNVSNLADQLKAPERFANGGTVPAMVSNGEAFVPPQVAKQIGYGKLNKMNQADRNGMSGFAGGGISIFKGPGSGTSDSIGPIGLPVGSFIIREKATKALGLNKGGAIGVVQRFADGSEGGVDSKGLSIVSMVLQKMAEDAEASVGQMARQVARAFDDVKGSGDLLAEDAESFLNEFAKAVEQVTGREFKVGGESINNLNPKQQVAAATRIREYVGTVGRDADRTAQQEREKETGRQKEVSSARDFKVSEGSASQIQQIIDEQKNRLITAFSKTGVSAEFIAGKVTEFNIVLGKLGEVTKDTNISELIQEMHAFQDATDGIDLTAAQQAAAKVVELIEPLTKLDVSAGEAKRKEEKRGFTGVEFGSLQEITAYFNELEGAFDIGAVLTIPETLAKIDAEIAAAERDLSTTLKGAFSGAAGTAAERKAVADASPEVQAAKTRVEELKSSRVSRVTAVGTEAGVETDVTVALIDYADRINSVSKEIEAAAREASKASKMEELALKRQKKVKLQAIKVAMSGITEGTYQERFAQAKAEVESGDPSSSAFHDLLEMQPAMDAAAQAVEEASLNSVVAAERLRQLEEERVRLAGETAGLAAGGAGSVALGIVGTDEGRAQAQKDYERANLRQQALAAGEQRAKIATGGQLPGENDEDYTKRYQENLMAQTRRSAKELGLVRTKVLSPREAEAQQKNETQTEEKKAKESASIQSRVQNLLIQAINKNTNALLGNEEETKSLQEEVSNLASKQEEMSREAESADKTTTDTFDINDAFKDDTYTITALDVLDDFGNMMNQKADAIAASFTDINGETSKAGKAIQSLGETIAAGSIGVKEGLRTVNESFINSKVGGVFKGLSSIGGLITGFIGTAGLQSAADAVGGYDTGLGGSLMVSADILSSATAFATAGSALGPLGTAAGAAVGAIKGLVDGIEAWQEAAEKARFAELEDLATRKAAMASQDFGVFFDSIEPDFEDFASGVRNLAETINAENEMIRSGQGPGEATKSTLFGFGKEQLEGRELTAWAQQMANMNQAAGTVSKDVIRKFMSAGNTLEEVEASMSPEIFNAFAQQIAEADSVYQRLVAEIAARAEKENWTSEQFRDAVGEARDAALERATSDLRVAQENDRFKKDVTEVRQRLESTGVSILEKIIGNTPEANQKYARSLQMATELMKGNTNATKAEEKRMYDEAYNRAGGGLEGRRAGEEAAAQVRQETTRAGMELLSLGDSTDQNVRNAKAQLLESQLQGMGVDTQNDPFSKAVLDSLRATDPSLELLGQIQENTKAAADALKNQAMDAGLLGLENAYGPQTLEEYRESVGGERRTGFGGIYDENKGNIWTGIGILGAGGVAAAFPGVRRSVRGGYRRGKQAFSDAWASDEELERRRAARAAEAEGGDGASRPRPTDTPDGKRKRSWWPFGGGDSGSGGSSSSGKKPKPSSPKGPRSPRGKPRMAGIDFIGYGAAALSGVGLASAFGGESGSDADMEALPADAEVIGLLAAIEANTRACCMGGGDGGGGAGRGGAFSVSAESSSQRTKPTEEEPARTLTDALADEFTTGNGLQYFVQSVIADAIGVRAAVGEIRSKARPATAAADEASAARPKVRPSTAAADEASAARPKLKPPTAAAEEATVARPRPAVDSSSRRYTSSGRAYVDETGQSYSTRTGQRLSGAADTSVVRNIEAQQPKPIVGVDGEAAVTTKSGSYRKGDRYYRKDGTEITSGQGKAAVQRALDAQAKRTAPKPLPGPETTRKPLPVPETTPKPPPAPETTRKPPPAPPPPPSEVTSTRPKLPSLPVVEPEPSRMPGIAGIANVGAQGVGAFLSGRAAMDQYSAGNTVYALNESAGVGAGLFNVLGAFGGGGGYNAFGAVGDTFSLARNLGRQFSGQSIEQGTVVQDAISTVADAAQITAQVPSIQTAGRTTVNAIKNAPQTAKSTIDIVKNLPSFIKQAPDLIKQAPQLIKNIPSLFSGASSPAVSAAASVGGNVFSQTAAKAVPFLGAALGGAFGYMAPTEQSANENDPYAQALSNRTSTANALYGALGAGPTTMGDVGAQSSLGWALGAEQGGMLDKQLGNWSQLGMGSLQNWWAGPYAPLVTATAMTGQELRALQTDQANEQAAIEKTARMEESYVEQQSKANEAYKDMSPEEILAIKNIATFETQRDKYQKLVDSGKGDEREWKSMPTKYIDDQGVERMTEGVKETMTNQEKLDQLNKRVGEGYVRLSKSKPAEPSGFFSFFGKKKPEKSPGEIRAMEKAIIEEEKKKLVGTYTTDVDTKPVDMSQTRLSSEAMPPSGITAAASPQTVVPELLAQSLSSVPGSDVGREGAFSSIPDLTESANRRMEASSGPAGRPINPAAAAVIDSVLERTRERRGGEAFSIPPEATGITGSARREIATGLAPMHPAAAAVIDSALERTRAETGPAGRTTFDTAGDFLTERMGFGSGSVTASNQEYRQNMFSVEPGLSTENFEPSQLMQLLSPGVAAQFGAPVVDLGPAPSNVSLPGGTTSDSSEITNALFGQSPGRNAILQQLATAPFSSLLSGFSPMLGLASSYFGAGGDGQTALSTVGEQLAGSDLSGLAVSNLLSGFNPLLGLAATAFGFGQPAQPVSATQANANKPPVQAQGMLTGTSLTPEEQNVMRQAPNLYNGGIVTSGTIDAALGQYQQQKQALEAARTTAVGNQAANVVQDMIPGEEKGAMVANQSVSAVQSGVSTNVAEPVIAQMSDAGIQFGQSFMGAITEPLNGLFGNFAQLLTEVQSKIPDVINMQGQHKLEIIINGADALKSINDDLKEMVETEIKAKIKNINNNLEGGLGLNP